VHNAHSSEATFVDVTNLNLVAGFANHLVPGLEWQQVQMHHGSGTGRCCCSAYALGRPFVCTRQLAALSV